MHEAHLYDIKDAARYLGVAPSTLRYWESEGLVHAERDRANDYRRYALHDMIEASEIAFYRKLGVPVKELASYPALSTAELDQALARTEEEVARRIDELEATRTRLARQRALNAQAEKLRRDGMRPGAPAIRSLSSIDYDSSAPWQLLVGEPWRYGVYIEAASPAKVHEAVVDGRDAKDAALWTRTRADASATCRECLLKVAPSMRESNAAALFDEAEAQGVRPRAIVGSYLLTASDHEGRWDYHRAWVVE